MYKWSNVNDNDINCYDESEDYITLIDGTVTTEGYDRNNVDYSNISSGKNKSGK